jgi:hypothetical protein
MCSGAPTRIEPKCGTRPIERLECLKQAGAMVSIRVGPAVVIQQ